MNSLYLTSLLILGMSLSALAHSANEATSQSASKGWMDRHREHVETAQQTPDCQLLFVGDSITRYWTTKGLSVWNERYAPLKAVNLGIPGDRTQHLLWRLQNGELAAMKPKVVVMMIGTNNIGSKQRNTATEAADGIEANLRYLCQQLPKAKILLLGIFPRGTLESPERAEVEKVNRLISQFEDGKQVFYLDLSTHFLQPDGEISREVMPDLLHPAPAAYQSWADAMAEPLACLLAMPTDYTKPE